MVRFASGMVFVVLVAAIVGGIFGLNQAGVRLQDVRDVFIIAWALFGILFFLSAIAATLGSFFAVRMLLGKVRELLDEPIKPAIEEVRGTLANVRETVEFVSDTAVSPLIRVVSVTRGVRRGMGALASIARRGR